MVRPLCLKATLALVCGVALCVLAGATRADDLDNIIFEGTIRDSAGAVIRAAEVRARHAATGVERAATTNAEGRYRIVMREPGVYRLTASASGFNQEESEEMEVTTGRAVKIDFQLSPAGVSEQITVGSDRTRRSSTPRERLSAIRSVARSLSLYRSSTATPSSLSFCSAESRKLRSRLPSLPTKGAALSFAGPRKRREYFRLRERPRLQTTSLSTAWTTMTTARLASA